MRSPKIVVSILIISILINIIQLYNGAKYKDVFENNIKVNLAEIFITSEGLDTILEDIINNRQTNSKQLGELEQRYSSLASKIQSLGQMANIYNIKNEKYWNLQFYSDVQRYIQQLVLRFEFNDLDVSLELTDNDILLFEKLKDHIDDISNIGLKYSYTEDSTRYYSVDQWIDIYKELSLFSYHEIFQGI